ncbi:tetratricopeptide repeat protein [Gilvimarinus sp. DA14]|uniref:tetratricopeptide repeat protein n=1 Tax=Gilvimarinus sp. DA14 TaxID=2956798 RepID=UPI0020B7C372|nr:tetratricopeptide repeat protein [Gilvimarinus sp. DA14]UTF60130.1 tetratricopeptide repeat protein [Gilvimarinus sp. DA14]
MNRFSRFIATVLLATTTSALAGQADIDAIENAYQKAQTDTLASLVDETRGYDQLLAEYRLGMLYSFSQQAERAKHTFNNLIEKLESHLAEHPDDAEALALLANVHGYTITLEPGKAASYGQKSYDALAKAQALAPASPRVNMIKGIIEFNTPVAYGGSKENARQSLTKAVKYYQDDVNSGIYWGHAEAHIWLGLTLMEQGDKNEALEHFQTATELEPNNSWAQHLLSSNSQ